MSWSLTIDAYPKSGNITLRMHWTAYRRLLAWWYMQVRTTPGFLKIPLAEGRRRVTIQLHGPRAMDKENRYFAVKPLVDILRPAKYESGIYKSGKRKGQPWTRNRLGHGLILDDNDLNLDLQVPPVQKANLYSYIVLTIEDISEQNPAATGTTNEVLHD